MQDTNSIQHELLKRGLEVFTRSEFNGGLHTLSDYDDSNLIEKTEKAYVVLGNVGDLSYIHMQADSIQEIVTALF